MPDGAFLDRCREAWQAAWALAERGESDSPEVPTNIRDAITASINSRTKSYRYVLPTQLCAKVADPVLDCRSIQAGGPRGSFDARSVCDAVIVPFDREHQNVLGGSPEPYVNNPLRIERFDAKHGKAKKDKPGFASLLDVLNHVESHPRHARSILADVARAVHARRSAVSVAYPTPRRASAEGVRAALAAFLSDRSGGLRLHAVARAIFECACARFALFDAVRGDRVNAADASTGAVADLECVDRDGRVVIGVEVKDRQLTLRQVQDKSVRVREARLTEFIFLVHGGVQPGDASAVAGMLEREFASGHNLYVCDFDAFVPTVLVLLGEAGRVDVLAKIGAALDAMQADYAHRLAWRDALTGL